MATAPLAVSLALGLALAFAFAMARGIGLDAGETPLAGQASALEPSDGVVEPLVEPPADRAASSASDAKAGSRQRSAAAMAAWERLDISEDYRASFDHGEKPAEFQKYIVLHDTEGDGDASSVIDWWEYSGRGVASHFIVNKDGSIVQCVPMDRIAHHAGYGDTGHNELYGVEEDSRDDMIGVTPIGDWAADYGMNAHSIGIELVHVGGSGDYPEAQLEALDGLIAYIDAYYGFESKIIDHKMWRSYNSDTSEEFAGYLANYQTARTHDGSTLEAAE